MASSGMLYVCEFCHDVLEDPNEMREHEAAHREKKVQSSKEYQQLGPTTAKRGDPWCTVHKSVHPQCHLTPARREGSIGTGQIGEMKHNVKAFTAAEKAAEKQAAAEAPGFRAALDNWVRLLNQYALEKYERGCREIRNRPPSDRISWGAEGEANYRKGILPHHFEYEVGPKYVRMIDTQGKSHRSAFAFVERSTGNILKTAGWKAPAKGPRGNIFSANLPLEGVQLYRR